MEIEELLFCKICHEKFNETLNRPFSLSCGHTLCEFCLKKIEKPDSYSCPFCKEKLTPSRQKVSTNYTVLEMVSNSKYKWVPMCETHKKESLKFLCKPCNSVICQECLLSQHLGPDHEIQSAANLVPLEPMKKHLDKIRISIDINLTSIKSGVELLEKDQSLCLDKLTKIKNKLHNMLDNEYETVVKTVKEKFQTSINKYSNMLNDFQAKSGKCDKFSEIMNSKSEQFISIDEDVKQIDSWMKKNEAMPLIKSVNSPMDVEDLMIIGTEQIHQIMEEQNPFYDPKMAEFLEDLKEDGVLKSSRVSKVMMKINRKNFIISENLNNAYIDRPMPIIKNTTISAPHMHARTLEELKDFLLPNIVAIDIGSGSGYIAAAMAELAGKNCKVYAVDHIQEIIDFSKANITKKNSYLIDENRIEFITCDGRKGLSDKAPFDVIHVGGALPSVPEELEAQLKNGGVMWIPVGPSGNQAIYLVEKDLAGVCRKRKLLDVSYGHLTTVQDQLNL